MVKVSMGLKLLLLLSVISVLLYILFIEYFTIYDTAVNKLEYSIQLNHKGNTSDELSKHLNKIEKKKFTKEEIENMSNLGKLLFLSSNGTYPPASQRSNKYLILVWQYGSYLERRHLRRFSSKMYSPWLDCSVECQLSYNSGDIKKADAVLFHLHRMKNRQQMPRRMNLSQRWVFLTDESPLHTFLYGNQELTDYNGLFNWSMSYRSDSDVPVPYGRTIDRQVEVDLTEFFGMFKKKNNLVAIMGSNCGGSNGRWNYVKHLKNLLGDHLDIYGHCLQGNIKACPGHFDNDCTVHQNLIFMLRILHLLQYWLRIYSISTDMMMNILRSTNGEDTKAKTYRNLEQFWSKEKDCTLVAWNR